MHHKKGSTPITEKDISDWEKRAEEEIQENDAVLIRTDHYKFWGPGSKGAEDFLEHGWPYLTKDAADYLVEKKIRLVGMESADIDDYYYGKTPKSHPPAHYAFLGNDIYIIENIANLDQLKKTRCFLISAPLKIQNGTGSPLRLIL